MRRRAKKFRDKQKMEKAQTNKELAILRTIAKKPENEVIESEELVEEPEHVVELKNKIEELQRQLNAKSL